MSKQRRKTRRDVAEMALSVVEKAVGEKLAGKPRPVEPPEPDTRNPAAVALSKLDASKGGKARAVKLGPKKCSQIAKKAAIARWFSR
mgnify:FL=1